MSDITAEAIREIADLATEHYTRLRLAGWTETAARYSVTEAARALGVECPV